MSLNFKEEKILDCWEEAMPLAYAEHQEMAPDLPIHLNDDAYCDMEKAGLLRIFTARTDDGKLVGFMSYVVGIGTPHMKRIAVANCLDWYLDPDERKGLQAQQFLKFVENKLTLEGVELMITPVMVNSLGAMAVLQRNNHLARQATFMKWLNTRH